MKLMQCLRASNGKPLRYRAEIMIWRQGKVLVTYNTRGPYCWYGLPGGGIEEGESVVEAAVREALEEVGIAVRNVLPTGEVHIGNNPPGMWGARARIYGGTHTTLVKGEYVGPDHSLYGREGDVANYLWMTPQEAHQVFLRMYEDNTDRGRHRLNEIEKYL